jgi:hypothetical protein
LTLCTGRLITGKVTRYPFRRRLGGGGAEPVWTGAENLAPTRIRSLDRLARRYTDSYPDLQIWTGVANIYISCKVGGALSFFPLRYVVTLADFGRAPNLISYQKQSWCITLFLSALELWLSLYAYRRFELRIVMLHLQYDGSNTV